MSSPFVDAFNVISLIAVFVLISLGLHFTFGMLGLVNLVHGELLLIGGYATYAVSELTGSVIAGMLAAPVVAGLVGLAMERGVLRFLYQRPLDSLLATFGLAVIIRQAVQLIYTSSPRNVPDLLRGSWTILGINMPRWRLVLALLAVLLVSGTWWLLGRTRFGLKARAVVANPDLAEIGGSRCGGDARRAVHHRRRPRRSRRRGAGPGVDSRPPVRAALHGQRLPGHNPRWTRDH